MIGSLIRLLFGADDKHRVVDRFSNGANSNAQNSVFRGTAIRRGVKAPKAIMAQEFYEVQLRRDKFFTAIFAKVKLLITGKSDFYRDMELMSHMIETVAAVDLYDATHALYLGREANAMSNGYRQFSNNTPLELYDLMEARKGEARAWVEKHKPTIENWKDLSWT